MTTQPTTAEAGGGTDTAGLGSPSAVAPLPPELWLYFAPGTWAVRPSPGGRPLMSGRDPAWPALHALGFGLRALKDAGWGWKASHAVPHLRKFHTLDIRGPGECIKALRDDNIPRTDIIRCRLWELLCELDPAWVGLDERQASAKYWLGGRAFDTKEQIVDAVQLILSRGEHDLTGDPLRLMQDLLLQHPRRYDKIGVGLAGIYVTRNPEFGGMMFSLRRVDGSTTDFSYRECLRKSSPLADFKAAARREIADQIEDFKARSDLVCSLTGEQCEPSTCHIDHADPWPFRKLLDAWCKAEQIESADIEGHGDNETELRFADRELAGRWAAFHRERAVLRVLSIDAHKAKHAQSH